LVKELEAAPLKRRLLLIIVILYNIIANIKHNKFMGIDSQMFASANQPTQKKDDFIMTATELHALRERRNTPEKNNFLQKLDERISQVTGGAKIDIFGSIIRKNEGGDSEQSGESAIEEEIIRVYAGGNLNRPLGDLPDEAIGKILKPIPSEARQMIYVQRNTMTIEKALEVSNRWAKDSVIGFHVSDKEIKNGLEAGSGDTSVYFSTDIKRLFHLNSAKYIYAFRLTKKTADSSSYGALDCFKKMQLKKGDKIEIEDSIKIFSEEDPSYRQRVLDSLGAKFDKSYSSVFDKGADFLESKADNEKHYSLPD